MKNKWPEPGVVAPGRLRQENHAGFEANIHETLFQKQQMYSDNTEVLLFN